MNTSLYLGMSLFNLEVKIAQMLKEKNNEVLSYLLRCLVSIWGTSLKEDGAQGKRKAHVLPKDLGRVCQCLQTFCLLKRY